LVFSLPASAGAAALPSGEDIDRLAVTSKSVAADFRAGSREVRVQYEYSGRFLKAGDKEELVALAKRASEKLRSVFESQWKTGQAGVGEVAECF
jgi:hypothetical protein